MEGNIHTYLHIHIGDLCDLRKLAQLQMLEVLAGLQWVSGHRWRDTQFRRQEREI